ncbi:MAG: hypothetical protein LBH59_02635 [Planctomycetaceae bacterium]|nr:hypothetical protein [Planctomycetaceae bacterium]
MERLFKGEAYRPYRLRYIEIEFVFRKYKLCVKRKYYLAQIIVRKV